MKKYQIELTLQRIECLNRKSALLSFTDVCKILPEMEPGQFAEILVEGAPGAMLRRPLSIHTLHRADNEVQFLIQLVGPGTERLSHLSAGDRVNVLLPLGKGFSYKDDDFKKPLLIGGGVGVAPLCFLGEELAKRGIKPLFLLGGQTSQDVLRIEEFAKFGSVLITTNDGSLGEKGFVTDHSALNTEKPEYDRIFACGPLPMMKAVAEFARLKNIYCEVSLENRMACGIGACLCCVEKTDKGNVCVCTEGPVFSIDKLSWFH